MSKIDLKRDMEKRLKNKFGRKHKRDAKLQELEKQLQFAESRCGTLKQQLDYIKLLYGCRKCPEIQIEPSYEPSTRGGGDNFNYYNYEDANKWIKPEVDDFVGNKEDGDCPDFVHEKASRSNTTCTNSNSSNKPNSTKDEEKALRDQIKLQKNFLKLQKMKKRNPKKIKRKRRIDDASSSKFSNVSSQTQSQIWQDPVVEIYKNAVANAESESGLEIFGSGQKKIKKMSEILLDIRRTTGLRDGEEWVKEKVVPEGEIKRKRSTSLNEKKILKGDIKEKGIQTDIPIESLVATTKPNTEIPKNLPENDDSFSVIKPEATVFEPVKGYCQPTISSKRKQVERDVYSTFNNINVRSIPFIAAKSTTPSHNIGVNIQQVLSIIKKRHHLGNENFIAPNESATVFNENNRITTSFGPKKVGYNDFERISEGSVAPTGSSQSKKRSDAMSKSSLSHWVSNSDFEKDKKKNSKELNSNQVDSGLDWSLKVDKLKKVLVFLHEDFTSLSQKYKKLQKRLTKRNISKADAKGELGEIERDLEKKEEEITVVIGLYKEVLSLREDLKKLQDKYNLVSCGKGFILDGLKQSNSAHTQMTTLLRKIQHFQDQLKG